MKPIIHQIHLGGAPLSPLIHRCIRSVNAYHPQPDFSHIVWDQPMLDAMGLGVEALWARYDNWASVTNWVRLWLLDRFGGIYLDTDVEALDCISRLFEHRAFAAIQDADRICNAVMGAEAGHPWIKWQLQNWEEFAQADAASGVYLASAAPRDGLTVIPTDWVYPFLWDAPEHERVAMPHSVLVHHWVGSWCHKS